MPKFRQTCTECSMRRQKCDREVPCGRCVKRGAAALCTRDWGGKYDPNMHRKYPRPSTSSSTANGSADTVPVTAPTQSSPALHDATHATDEPDLVGSEVLSLPYGRRVENQYGTLESPPSSKWSRPGDMDSAASVLEFLTWGRSKLSEFDVRGLDLLKTPRSGREPGVTPDADLINGLGGARAAQISFMQLLLPDRQQIFQLVDYHTRCILWYHGSYHGPTFTRELQDAYRSPNPLQLRNMDLRWAALLFSIIAGSMTCASERTVATWGFSQDERIKLTRQWLKATISCLEIANYMSVYHIYSVQAIVVLTMSSHLLGYSNEQSILLSAATRIAQSLGLQRLGPDVDELYCCMEKPLTEREKIVRREVGRRVWCQLCCQDWWQISFVETYSINPSHFIITKPINFDDETMAPLPTSIPTRTSFASYIFDVAILMPQLHDAMLMSNTPLTKYEQVLEYDIKMRMLATDSIPKFFSPREAISPLWPEWIPWARRSLAINFAHKIIMIHRNFLGRSFTNECFAFTRRTCIAAAKTILKEVQQAYDDEGPSMWIDQAFMVAAGITLSLDVFHRNKNEPEFDEHQDLVANAITMLEKFRNSSIAGRGMRLLSALLSELSKQTDTKRQNGQKRMANTDGDLPDPKIRKFDIPSFVESFCGNDRFSQWPDREPNGPTSRNSTFGAPNEAQTTRDQTADDGFGQPEWGYDFFAELFPPATGISNQCFFEDLLNFDVF